MLYINAVFLFAFRDRERGEAKELRAYNENKKQLKEDRARKGRTAEEEDELRAQGADEELDALWARVREFLGDLKPNGDKKERRGAGEANRLKLTDAFAAHDPARAGAIAKHSVVQAFTAAGLTPPLTAAQCDRLVGALDAWEQRGATVVYRRFLEAPYAREHTSVRGLFPRVRPREPSKYEVERKARAEEEERKSLEAAEEERRKRGEAHTKRLAG